MIFQVDLIFSGEESAAAIAWEKAKGAAEEEKVKFGESEVEGKVLDEEAAKAAYEVAKKSVSTRGTFWIRVYNRPQNGQ